MSYKVGDKEYESVISLEADKRYIYFIKKICDWEEVWSIKDEEGWCLMGNPNEQACIPIWPAQRYAQAFCTKEWKNCTPASISLERWIKSWLPGIARDEKLVAIFPVSDMRGVIRNSSELLQDIEEELKNYM